MLKQVLLAIEENTAVAENVYRMVLKGDCVGVSAPGQFINIKLSGHFLRRPISVSDYDKDSVVILYKIAGEGTKEMTELKPGTELDVLTGLGNGFDVEKAKEKGHVLLLGGGIGSAPMLALCKELKAAGLRVSAVLGFNTAKELILADELESAGAEVTVMTADGSTADYCDADFKKGFVTDAPMLQGDIDDCYYYACGPLPMLKSVFKNVKCDGELSFEERMGCGFGACMGCTMHTVHGAKRVCKDGPVFAKSELLWD